MAQNIKDKKYVSECLCVCMNVFRGHIHIPSQHNNYNYVWYYIRYSDMYTYYKYIYLYMCVCIYTYREAYFKTTHQNTKIDHIPFSFLKQQKWKSFLSGPTRGLCLFCLCQLISSSIGSVDPQSFQIPLPSVACIAHQAMQLYCLTEM